MVESPEERTRPVYCASVNLVFLCRRNRFKGPRILSYTCLALCLSQQKRRYYILLTAIYKERLKAVDKDVKLSLYNQGCHVVGIHTKKSLHGGGTTAEPSLPYMR